jgi:hypothetical protein
MKIAKNVLSKDILIPATVSLFVPAFLAMIGFGIYHGSFHMNANTTHCHSEVCHNH